MKKIESFDNMINLKPGTKISRIKKGIVDRFLIVGLAPSPKKNPNVMIFQSTKNVEKFEGLHESNFSSYVFLSYEGNDDYDSKIEGEIIVDQLMKEIYKAKKIFLKEFES